MTNLGKLWVKLERLESEFKKQLVIALEYAKNDSHSRFFQSEQHNPYKEMDGRTDKTTNELIDDANEILNLRRSIGESLHSEAAMFISACSEFNAIDNEHRLGVRKLAAKLLEEIDE